LPFGFRRPEMGELPQIVQHHVETKALQIPDEPFPIRETRGGLLSATASAETKVR